MQFLERLRTFEIINCSTSSSSTPPVQDSQQAPFFILAFVPRQLIHIFSLSHIDSIPKLFITHLDRSEAFLGSPVPTSAKLQTLDVIRLVVESLSLNLIVSGIMAMMLLLLRVAKTTELLTATVRYEVILCNDVGR